MVKENDDKPKEPASTFSVRLNIRDLDPGDRVALYGGIVAEVVDNPRDGMWMRARYITVPSDTSKEGTEDQIFATDVMDRA